MVWLEGPKFSAFQNFFRIENPLNIKLWAKMCMYVFFQYSTSSTYIALQPLGVFDLSSTSLRRLCFYTCLSVILFTRGIESASRGGGLHGGLFGQTPPSSDMTGCGQREGGTHPTGMHSSSYLYQCHLRDVTLFSIFWHAGTQTLRSVCYFVLTFVFVSLLFIKFTFGNVYYFELVPNLLKTLGWIRFLCIYIYILDQTSL